MFLCKNMQSYLLKGHLVTSLLEDSAKKARCGFLYTMREIMDSKEMTVFVSYALFSTGL